MKKFIFKISVVLFVGLGLLVMAGSMLLAPASRAAVTRGARSGLGVEASLGGIDAGLGASTSSLSIRDLVIDNPDGIRSSGPFLAIGELSTGIETLSVLSTTVKVPTITLEDLHLRLALDGKRSNVGEILGHVRALGSRGRDEGGSDEAGSSGDGAPQPPEGTGGAGPQGESDAKTLMVGRLKVQGVKLSAEVQGLGALNSNRTLELPPLDFDITSAIQDYLATQDAARQGDGVTMAELTGILVDELVARGLEAAEADLPPEVVHLLSGGITGLDERARELLDQHLEETVSRIEGEAKELEDELRGDVDRELDRQRSKLEEAASQKLKGLLGGDG